MYRRRPVAYTYIGILPCYTTLSSINTSRLYSYTSPASLNRTTQRLPCGVLVHPGESHLYVPWIGLHALYYIYMSIYFEKRIEDSRIHYSIICSKISSWPCRQSIMMMQIESNIECLFTVVQVFKSRNAVCILTILSVDTRSCGSS